MIPWQSPEFDDHEQVVAFADTNLGLRCIIAVHSTHLGPAVGGTRFWPYPDDSEALADVLRLSRAMSYKCAMAGVPCGGGKAVIIGDPRELKSKALLEAYGGFLNRIGSHYATGEDVGFGMEDCEAVRRVSPFVAGTASAGAGDPSVHTAMGVFQGLLAVADCRFDGRPLGELRFAIQGLGNVGMRLAEMLASEGAELTVADVDPGKVAAAVAEFGARSGTPETIHAADVDVFCPCALGGAVNDATVDQIRAAAVAGAANNQLTSVEIGTRLRERGILYAPDYVINAGGVIGGQAELAKIPGRNPVSDEPFDTQVTRIYSRLTETFEASRAEGITPECVADRMARTLINR